MPDDFSISATPAYRTVTPGAEISYFLDEKLGGPSLDEVEARWYCVNDRQFAPSMPKVFQGPRDTQWLNATWSFPGHHQVVCEVTRNGRVTAYKYEQWVVPLADELGKGPIRPQLKEDPEAALDAVARFVVVLKLVGEKEPPKDEEQAEKFKDAVAQNEMFRDMLEGRLKSTEGLRKHHFHSEHFDASSQQRFQLRGFISKVAFKEYKIVDWTNPMVRASTGEYSGFGQNASEALPDAFKAWDAHNRYPKGGITYKTPAVHDAGELSGHFETDGSARWDSVAAFFGWVGLGAAAIAGVVTLLAPVPGSRVASAAIWTSIFSSSAAAAINIGTRVDEGFSSWQANAFDVLTIVGNLFGAAGFLWTRGANVVLQTSKGAVKYALIGAIGTDAIQGVMLGGEHLKRYDEITNDPTLPPHERTMALVELFRSAALDGLLLYVSVRATKADLENLGLKSGGPDGLSPAEKLERLKDPNVTIDTTKPVTVEGAGKKGEPQTTKVDIDEEFDTPHSWTAPKKVPKKPDAEAFRDAMGHGHHGKLAKEVPQLRAKHAELAQLTDDEIIAVRGYCGNEAKPEFADMIDYQRINAALRNNDKQQLSILKPYVDLISSALAKLPKHEGGVFRIMHGIDPDVVRQQFVKGGTWEAKSFLSTSYGKPLDHAQVTLEIRNTSKGSHVSSVNPFPEREVLFQPATRLTVKHVLELPGERFYIVLEATD